MSQKHIVEKSDSIGITDLAKLAREAFDAGFAIGSIVEGWTSEQAWADSKIKRRLDNGDQHE